MQSFSFSSSQSCDIIRMKFSLSLIFTSTLIHFISGSSVTTNIPPRTSEFIFWKPLLLSLILFLLIQVCRDGYEVKVCGFDSLDLEAGESILDEKCYFTKCGEKYELISGYPPMQGRVCEPKTSKNSLGYQYKKPCGRF